MHTRMQLFTSVANSWDVKFPTIVGRKIPYNPTQNVIITDIARTAIEDRVVSASTEHSQMSVKAETKGAEQLPRSPCSILRLFRWHSWKLSTAQSRTNFSCLTRYVCGSDVLSVGGGVPRPTNWQYRCSRVIKVTNTLPHSSDCISEQCAPDITPDKRVWHFASISINLFHCCPPFYIRCILVFSHTWQIKQPR